MAEKQRIALLIDCENVSHKAIKGVLEELANYGTTQVRHAHGDWNNQALSGWHNELHHYAIRPIQQFAYIKGKNVTDSAMIIDAMDLLYSSHVDAFALMTSDSDFTPLVIRILEGGLPVYGFGEKKTPLPFVCACSRFIFIENLVDEQTEVLDKNIPATTTKKDRNALQKDSSLVRLLMTATEYTSDDDGWAYVGTVGLYISNNSSFSSINFGYKKLGELIRATSLFDVEMRKDGTAMFIKPKK